jgi:hypothetical protein
MRLGLFTRNLSCYGFGSGVEAPNPFAIVIVFLVEVDTKIMIITTDIMQILVKYHPTSMHAADFELQVC